MINILQVLLFLDSKYNYFFQKLTETYVIFEFSYWNLITAVFFQKWSF